MKNGNRKILFSLIGFILIFLAVFTIFVLLEIVASCFVSLPNANLRNDFRLNHTWRFNSSFTHNEWTRNEPQYKPYTHRYNKQGWIGFHDVAGKKPDNIFRIFYVGDSFVEGTVPMDGSVPAIVEKYLNGQENKGIKFEVINTGTSSYSPVLYYILIRYYISRYSPDLIVVCVDMTDVFDDWKYRQTMIVDSEGDPWAVLPGDIYRRPYVDTGDRCVKSGLWSRAKVFLFANSYLFNIFYRPGRSADKNDITDSSYSRWAWCSDPWDAKTEKQVNFSMDILARIASYCRQNNVKLLLTGVPYYQQLVSGPNGKPAWSIRPHQEIEKVALKNGAVYFDSVSFMEPFVKGTAQTVYYYKNNTHFNPQGYKIWSQAHIKALTDNLRKGER